LNAELLGSESANALWRRFAITIWHVRDHRERTFRKNSGLSLLDWIFDTFGKVLRERA
jgi:hypothetical protein